MAWIDPNSVTANGWTDAANSIDANISTFATHAGSGRNTWCPWLEVHLTTAIDCTQIRVYASRQSTQVSGMQVEAYYNGAWNLIYDNVAIDSVYETITLGDAYSVSDMRVRFYMTQSDRSAYAHVMQFGEVEAEYAEGGSQATVVVSHQGAGTKISSGSSSATTSIAPDGNGVKLASSGSTSTVTIDTEGVGQIVTSVIEGGSEAQVIVLAEAAGIKQARSPPADAMINIGTEGAGIKIASGASEIAVNITADGSGIKDIADGSDSEIIISAEGIGQAVLDEYAEGGSVATIVIRAEGLGKTKGESIMIVLGKRISYNKQSARIHKIVFR